MYVTLSDTLNLAGQLPNVHNVSSSGTYSIYCAMFGDYKNDVTKVCTCISFNFSSNVTLWVPWSEPCTHMFIHCQNFILEL